MNYRAGGPSGRPLGKDNWRTPTELYERLDAKFGFTIDAACTKADCLAPTGLYRDLGHDALLEEWGPPGSVVWCNPPYSQTRLWLPRALVQSHGRVVVLLIPSDTSTQAWAVNVAPHASEVRFIVGRPRFRTPEGGDHYTKRGGGGTTTPCAVVVFRGAGSVRWPVYSYVQAKPR